MVMRALNLSRWQSEAGVSQLVHGQPDPHEKDVSQPGLRSETLTQKKALM